MTVRFAQVEVPVNLGVDESIEPGSAAGAGRAVDVVNLVLDRKSGWRKRLGWHSIGDVTRTERLVSGAARPLSIDTNLRLCSERGRSPNKEMAPRSGVTFPYVKSRVLLETGRTTTGCQFADACTTDEASIVARAEISDPTSGAASVYLDIVYHDGRPPRVNVSSGVTVQAAFQYRFSILPGNAGEFLIVAQNNSSPPTYTMYRYSTSTGASVESLTRLATGAVDGTVGAVECNQYLLVYFRTSTTITLHFTQKSVFSAQLDVYTVAVTSVYSPLAFSVAATAVPGCVHVAWLQSGSGGMTCDVHHRLYAMTGSPGGSAFTPTYAEQTLVGYGSTSTFSIYNCVDPNGYATIIWEKFGTTGLNSTVSCTWVGPTGFEQSTRGVTGSAGVTPAAYPWVDPRPRVAYDPSSSSYVTKYSHLFSVVHPSGNVVTYDATVDQFVDNPVTFGVKPIVSVDGALSVLSWARFRAPRGGARLGVSSLNEPAIPRLARINTQDTGVRVLRMLSDTRPQNMGLDYLCARVNGASYCAAGMLVSVGQGIAATAEFAYAPYVFPPQPTSDGTSLLVPGTYSWVARYVVQSRDGTVVYSDISNVVTATLASTSRVKISFAGYFGSPASFSDGDTVAVEIYRTKAASSLDPAFYRITQQSSVTFTATTTRPLAGNVDGDFTDYGTGLGGQTEAIILDKQLFPEALGPFVSVAAHMGRVFAAPDYPRGVVYFSQRMGDGRQPIFNRLQTITLPDATARVTGFSTVGDQLLVLTETDAYLVAGEGPADDGVSDGSFSEPSRVGKSFGCPSPRTIVTTKAGVIWHTGTYFCLFGGAQVLEIGRQVAATCETRPVQLGGFLSLAQDVAVFLVDQAGGGAPALLCYNYSAGAWSRFTSPPTYAFRMIADSEYAGVAACDSLSSSPVFVYGDTGVPYRFYDNPGQVDAGATWIPSTYKTGEIGVGPSSGFVRLRRVELTLDCLRRYLPTVTILKDQSTEAGNVSYAVSFSNVADGVDAPGIRRYIVHCNLKFAMVSIEVSDAAAPFVATYTDGTVGLRLLGISLQIAAKEGLATVRARRIQ